MGAGIIDTVSNSRLASSVHPATQRGKRPGAHIKSHGKLASSVHPATQGGKRPEAHKNEEADVFLVGDVVKGPFGIGTIGYVVPTGPNRGMIEVEGRLYKPTFISRDRDL